MLDVGLFLVEGRREAGERESENDMAAEPELVVSREKRLGVAEEEGEEAEGCGGVNECEPRVCVVAGEFEDRGPCDNSMAFRISGC